MTERLDIMKLWQSGALLYSKLEAALILRLAEGKPDNAKDRAIDRLVDRHQLRPTLLSGKRFFSRTEIERCVERLTATDAA